MSNASASPARASIPRPAPLHVPPKARPRIESLSDADFALVEEPRPEVPRPGPRPPSAAPASSRRPRGEDLIPMLFDQIHGMDLLTDALEGARFVLAVLGETIPSRASLVHLYDASRRAFVVVAARGEQKDSMILSRQDGRDPLLRALMPGGRPFAWRNLREVSIRGIPRFAELSHIDSVVAAPVSIGSRWMGVIELVDPLSRGGNGLGTAEENGLAYVADRYAAYLSTRGVIVDVAEIARFALTS